MASPDLFYPLRKVIRYRAQAYLTAVPEAYAANFMWDQVLFDELSSTLLQPSTQPLLALAHGSREAAALTERQLAKSLVDTYRHTVQQRQDERIKRLNALL